MEASIMQTLDKCDRASVPVELYLTLMLCQIICYTLGIELKIRFHGFSLRKP